MRKQIYVFGVTAALSVMVILLTILATLWMQARDQLMLTESQLVAYATQAGTEQAMHDINQKRYRLFVLSSNVIKMQDSGIKEEGYEIWHWPQDPRGSGGALPGDIEFLAAYNGRMKQVGAEVRP